MKALPVATIVVASFRTWMITSMASSQQNKPVEFGLIRGTHSPVTLFRKLNAETLLKSNDDDDHAVLHREFILETAMSLPLPSGHDDDNPNYSPRPTNSPSIIMTSPSSFHPTRLSTSSSNKPLTPSESLYPTWLSSGSVSPASSQPTASSSRVTTVPSTIVNSSIRTASPTGMALESFPPFPLPSKSPLDPTESPSAMTTFSTSILLETEDPVNQDVIFICTSEGIVLAFPPFQFALLSLQFNVGYMVESSITLEEVLMELEPRIIASALSGVLQCSNNTPNLQTYITMHVRAETLVQSTACFPKASPQNECLIVETRFEIIVPDEVSRDLALLVAYGIIQEDMDDGVLTHEIPAVDRILYLSPRPLFHPYVGPWNEEIDSINEASSRTSLNFWTLTAALVIAGAGMIALCLWTRNRQTRNNRHMHLVEVS